MKERTLKKKELSKILAWTLGLVRHLYGEYVESQKYNIPALKVGDWAIERSYMGQFPIEAILKITDMADTSFTGTDLLGEKRTWNNASFVPLPKHCQDYLDGKYKW